MLWLDYDLPCSPRVCKHSMRNTNYVQRSALAALYKYYDQQLLQYITHCDVNVVGINVRRWNCDSMWDSAQGGSPDIICREKMD